ncbi:taste receptor type 1 member 1-like [Polymixia lowei]
MKQFLVSLYLLGLFQHAVLGCTLASSDFQLPGDYLLGGLFDVHLESGSIVHERPEAIDCSSQEFVLSSYRKFQVMRFAVEEINNSTALLPNVSLGYQIFDHCSDKNFPAILDLISANGTIRLREEMNNYPVKVIGVVGPFGSAETLTMAPLFMMNLIPLISYGSASSALTDKHKYPSFLRTVPSSRDIIHLIITMMQHFDWRWVAFLRSRGPYGKDGLELFQSNIMGTGICLAYIELLDNVDYVKMFKEIEAQRISVIVVFSFNRHAEELIRSAIRLNITNKVWIATDAWSMNKKLPKLKGIKNIGTILGVAEAIVALPRFDDFMYSKDRPSCVNAGQQQICNQVCDCSGVSPEQVIAVTPAYSFPVYAATYAIAHALHNVLQCGSGRCRDNITVYPYMVLAELKKSNFTVLSRGIQFDANSDLKYSSFAVVFWNNGHAEEIGAYKSPLMSIDSSKIQWHTNGTVPIAVCSNECPAGYARKQDGIHKCCFECNICPNNTFINSTEDAYKCVPCKDIEWSEGGSTSCKLRSVKYVPFTEPTAMLIVVGTLALEGLSLAMAILFAVNYNTPVVKSAGGPMCFLILGCLSLCSISVFFYFDKPTVARCILRYLPFLLFFTPCLACFVVRAFQIVCVFKMAAKFPKLHGWWMKYNGQWLVITVAFLAQAFLLTVGYAAGPPKPYNDTRYDDKTILGCDNGNLELFFMSVLLLVSLCFLCFVFSYMGKDLPKNYNEAKAITFCLLLLILTWVIYATLDGLYHDVYIQTLNALAVLSSLYCILLWYFLPKCYIIIFQPHKNTQQYFQGLIQSYTMK